jgi:hypothetical protein
MVTSLLTNGCDTLSTSHLLACYQILQMLKRNAGMLTANLKARTSSQSNAVTSTDRRAFVVFLIKLEARDEGCYTQLANELCS